MEYEIDVTENVFEVTLREKITFSDLDGFRAIVKQMVDSNLGNNIIDLSNVNFIDSAGLGMLLLARDEIFNTPSKLTLRAPSGQVKRMFTVACFDKMFTIEKG